MGLFSVASRALPYLRKAGQAGVKVAEEAKPVSKLTAGQSVKKAILPTALVGSAFIPYEQSQPQQAQQTGAVDLSGGSQPMLGTLGRTTTALANLVGSMYPHPQAVQQSDADTSLMANATHAVDDNSLLSNSTYAVTEPVQPQYTAPPQMANTVEQYCPVSPITGQPMTQVSPDCWTDGHVLVNGVGFYGDNGGSQHYALQGVMKDPRQPMTFGEMLGWGALLNGKRSILDGGINNVLQGQQALDKANAYNVQGLIGNEVQRLMSEGRSYDEARYEATARALGQQGLTRAMVGVALPEYGRSADARAQRELDYFTATNGDTYAGQGAFGYTPLGTSYVTTNKDGTKNVKVGRTVVNGADHDAYNYGVYGVLNGGAKGVGTQQAQDYNVQKDTNNVEFAKWRYGQENQNKALGLGISAKSSSSTNNPYYNAQQQARLQNELLRGQLLQQKVDENGNKAKGATTRSFR